VTAILVIVTNVATYETDEMDETEFAKNDYVLVATVGKLSFLKVGSWS